MSGQLLLSWSARAPSCCEALRRLLEDGQWHTHRELTRVGGARFGARLLELRAGEDGGEPLAIEKRSVAGDVGWEYRSAGPAERPHEPRSVAVILAELRAEVVRLRELNAELEFRLRALGGAGR